MSSERVHAVAKTAHHAAIHAVWAQWSALTPTAAPVTDVAGDRLARSMIDPETLVLLSLALRHEEPRLLDLLAAWAERGATLLSVQRITTLAKWYSDDVRQALGEFAALAVAAGDGRWRRHAVALDRVRWGKRRKDLGPIRLLDGPALMLRLRAGFGVGAKADLLAFLLGHHDGGAMLRTIALATGYTTRAIRKAVDDMCLAGLITRIDGPPPMFYIPYRPWAEVLAAPRLRRKPDPSRTIPPWRYWVAIFAFLARVARFAEEAHAGGWTPYIASSRARDLMQAYEVPFKRARLPVPVAAAARGTDYLGEFEAFIRVLAEWIDDNI